MTGYLMTVQDFYQFRLFFSTYVHGKWASGMKPEIALETSTMGKYVARMLKDMGFSVHLADPVKLPLIFKASKKNDKKDLYKLAKLLRLEELPEIHIPSKESEELRSLVRYRKSPGEDITRIKNKIQALLARYGVSINATDIFGRKGIKEMERLSAKIGETDNIVLSKKIRSKN